MQSRRGFLKLLGLGAAAVAVEPVRKLWFVGSNAPVGSRIERMGSSDLTFGTGPDTYFEVHTGFKGEMGGRLDAYRAAFDAKVATMMQGGELYREMHLLYGNQPPQTLAGRLETLNELGRRGMLEQNPIRALLNGGGVRNLWPDMAIQHAAASDHVEVLDHERRLLGRIPYEAALEGRWEIQPV